MTDHKLKKTETGWICELCQQQWKKKPRAKCPGVVWYDNPNQLPSHLIEAEQLAAQNLKPKGNAIGCLKRSKNWVWLFDSSDVETINPELPPIYTWNNRPKDLKTPNQLYRYNRKPGDKPHGCIRHEGDWLFLYRWEECPIDDESLPPHCEYGLSHELKTLTQLKKENLAPRDDTQPRGFFRVWKEEWKTVLLYHPNDCDWKPPDSFLTKGTLRNRYLLSKSWINRLGKPDLIRENPHHKSWTAMQLYSRQRVENFLADHAEEYSQWLDRRDRYVAIFKANTEAIKQGHTKYLEIKNKRKTQQKQCLKCASGCATSQGFLCAIYPVGLEDWQMPCSDFVARG
ncbi:hypothetical protein [Coleofasciculus sp.]|uniref:hypothetical protein n=1 Tax=Coleofasciculus sp. TaxID=3100458 RepID=UPI0039F7EC54